MSFAVFSNAVAACVNKWEVRFMGARARVAGRPR
jgi:hypothetical protein